MAHPSVDLVLAHLRTGGAAPRAVEGMRVPDAVTTAAAVGVEVTDEDPEGETGFAVG